MRSESSRVRVTISLAKEVAGEIDELIDGVKIRNRSHAIESILSESLHLAQLRTAVILAGGEEVESRLPAIRSAIELVQAQDVQDILMLVGFMGDTVRQVIGKGNETCRIKYVQSDQGTGGALREIKSKLKGTFLVLNLSQPVHADLHTLMRFHREHKPVATIATSSLHDLSGIYLFEPEVFDYIPQGFCMLEDSVFPTLMKHGKLLPYPILTQP